MVRNSLSDALGDVGRASVIARKLGDRRRRDSQIAVSARAVAVLDRAFELVDEGRHGVIRLPPLVEMGLDR